MHTHGASLFAAVLAGMLELAALVHAQAPSATVQGTVVDESAAVVPGVRVTVLNVDTGVQRTLTSGENGAFVVSLLPPGRYQIAAEHRGFVPTTMQSIILNVGDAIDLKLVMKVAGIDSSVLVTAPAARVSTSPSVSTVVDRQFVANLPLNGRSFQSLIAITPGRGDDAGELGESGAVQRQRPAAEHELLHG